MTSTATLIVYCVLIVLASLAGGWLPIVVRLTHKRLELAVSFVAGVMLGVALLHMLPHALLARAEAVNGRGLQHAGADQLSHDLIGPLMLWLLAGFLLMFLIERFFCFHHHDAPGGEAAHDHVGCAHEGHEHHHHHLTWAGAAIGLAIHSLIEGVALAASMQVGHAHGTADAGLAGLGVFIVILLHKPFDSLTLGTLMNVGGRSIRSRHAVNLAFSLLIPLGAAVFYLGLSRLDGAELVISAALAFSAGTFLCIAMSDLLPELQFHQHDRVKLSAALLAGLAVAWLIGALESRLHGHSHPEQSHIEAHIEERHEH